MFQLDAIMIYFDCIQANQTFKLLNISLLKISLKSILLLVEKGKFALEFGASF